MHGEDSDNTCKHHKQYEDSIHIHFPYLPLLDEDVAPNFIPLNIRSNLMFNLMANLMCPGMMFSSHDCFFVAILSLSNKHLSSSAHDFLAQHIGKWISWELDSEGKQAKPVFWAMNFMRLLKMIPDDLLTPKEIDFRDHYLRISTITTNMNATINIMVSLFFDGLREYSTYKINCPIAKGGCGQNRCFTLFPGSSDVCALCINKELEEAQSSVYKTPSKICDAKRDKADWAQCWSCNKIRPNV